MSRFALPHQLVGLLVRFSAEHYANGKSGNDFAIPPNAYFKAVCHCLADISIGGWCTPRGKEYGKRLGQKVFQLKAHPRLLYVLSSSSSQCKVFLSLLSFGRMESLGCPNWTPHFGGVRVDVGVENGIIRNVDPKFIFNFNTQRKPILHRFGPLNISYRRINTVQ